MKTRLRVVHARVTGVAGDGIIPGIGASAALTALHLSGEQPSYLLHLVLRGRAVHRFGRGNDPVRYIIAGFVGTPGCYALTTLLPLDGVRLHHRNQF